jgi:hypothetical protein
MTMSETGTSEAGATARTTSDGDALIVVAAALAIVVAAVWLLVLWLPYVRFGGTSLSLMDGRATEATWPMSVQPRIIGIALVLVFGLTTLALRRVRLATWCATAGALLGLMAFCASWALSTLTSPGWGGGRGIALLLDLLLPLCGLASIVVGAIGAGRCSTGRRTRSMPYAAAAAGGLGVVALVLMTRNRGFLPAMATSSQALFSVEVPLSIRLVGIASAVVMVALPVLAALASDPRATIGLALGWVAYVAVLATEVVAGRNLNPLQIGAPFIVGALLVVVGAAALIAWGLGTDRTADPLERTRAERRERTEPAAGFFG